MLCSGKLHLPLLLSSELKLITNTEEVCDSEEGPAKRELGLASPLRASGREPQTCPDLIFSRRGRKTTQWPRQEHRLAPAPAYHTPTRGEFAISHEDERGEAQQGFPEAPWGKAGATRTTQGS